MKIPISGICGITNSNKGTQTKPVIIDAIAPFSLYRFQKSMRIITGQNVAAIPDQPKIITQNTCLSGET